MRAEKRLVTFGRKTPLKTKRKKETSSQETYSSDDTANRIVSAATRLFAEKGYDGTSTKEICETAGVNIAAIHYHFDSKENLYRRIIEQFVSARLDSARRTLQTPRSPDDLKVRLEIFLRETLESIIQQPDLVLIIQREMEMFHSRSEDVFRNTMLKHFETLVEFLVQAKKNGLLTADVNPFFAAGALFSQISHQTRTDQVVKKYFGYSLSDEKYRSRWIQQTLRLFLGGVTEK